MLYIDSFKFYYNPMRYIAYPHFKQWKKTRFKEIK